MRRPFAPNLLPAAALFLLVASACGKRSDPLAPYVKTPQPPTSLEVAQVGAEVEVRVEAPRTTTESRPLPVIELEWLEAAPTGPLEKGAKVIEHEDVAPGELRVKRFPIRTAPSRFTARARSGKATSAFAAAAAYTPKPVPSPPTGLQATVRPDGVFLVWTNPPGAEPWPTPSPTPSPSPSASPSPSPLVPAQTPSVEGPPVPPSPEAPKELPKTLSLTASPPVEPGPPAPPSGEKTAESGAPALPSPPVAPVPSASPRPPATPTPTPLPPTGIRIVRTDGTPRPATAPLQASSWLDATVQPGDKPCYAISYATGFKPLVVSVQSEPVCVEIKDVTPPEAPTRLAADLTPTFVELSWAASTSADVARYRLYRTIGIGARELAIETDSLVLRVQDPTLTSGPRTYEVVAVDKAGNESPATPPTRIVVP